MSAPVQVTLAALPGIPDVQPGDDLAGLMLSGLDVAGLALAPGDVLVVTSKLVSKAEGRYVDLRTVTPSARAERIAARTRKDPRLVELILRESTAISRIGGEVLIVRHKLGFTLANAGIDHSNVGRAGEDWVLLLPEDPDASAAALRAHLAKRAGVAPGVIISDSHGRPWRIGTVGVAIGLAGLPGVWDRRGDLDRYGRVLRVTVTGLGDEIAAAAGMVSGQAAEGRPVVLVRGLTLPPGEGCAADLVRPREVDLYGDALESWAE